MLYDYECPSCNLSFERILPLSMCDEIQSCPNCGSHTKKIIRKGHGGIQRKGDAVQWVRDAAKILTDGDSPNQKLESIDDLRRYYRDHPNVIPEESHPAFPSSMGDAYDRPDAAYEKAQRSKKGHELIRKMRSIEVSGQATA